MGVGIAYRFFCFTFFNIGDVVFLIRFWAWFYVSFKFGSLVVSAGLGVGRDGFVVFVEVSMSATEMSEVSCSPGNFPCGLSSLSSVLKF